MGQDRQSGPAWMCHTLIIEDDWLIAEHISDIATRAGALSVEVVATEADAVSAAMARRPEMILSDVKLATGTGPAAVFEIRQRLGAIPVIFITGTPEACDPCDYAAAVLEKPIDEKMITTHFRRVAPL